MATYYLATANGFDPFDWLPVGILNEQSTPIEVRCARVQADAAARVWGIPSAVAMRVMRGEVRVKCDEEGFMRIYDDTKIMLPDVAAGILSSGTTYTSVSDDADFVRVLE